MKQYNDSLIGSNEYLGNMRYSEKINDQDSSTPNIDDFETSSKNVKINNSGASHTLKTSNTVRTHTEDTPHSKSTSNLL